VEKKNLLPCASKPNRAKFDRVRTVGQRGSVKINSEYWSTGLTGNPQWTDSPLMEVQLWIGLAL